MKAKKLFVCDHCGKVHDITDPVMYEIHEIVKKLYYEISIHNRKKNGKKHTYDNHGIMEK